jgi:replication fork clamp-binding protein CrfC
MLMYLLAFVGFYSQSSGKSSVLENLVGKDFLPRGSGIVTRRPLILQLVNIPPKAAAAATDSNKSLDHGHEHDQDQDNKPSASSGRVAWGEFLHKPSEVFEDFAAIREEIMRETDREAGKNKGISRSPIRLKIFSPTVVNLTLVDLPGMTRVPVGDQPSDIEQMIRGLVLEYASKPSSIILAVTPANTDLANSDALQIARKVDPEGQRTLGVITKLDLMDKGTDAMDVLNGHIIPLKLGFIGVVNRSQSDIIGDKPITQAIQAEHRYFQTHAMYRRIAHRCGTAYLTSTLSHLLMSHIRAALPDLRTRVQSLLADAQQEMARYGNANGIGALDSYDVNNPNPFSLQNRAAILLQLLTAFSAGYKDAIDGRLPEPGTSELYGGARIHYIFYDIFGPCLNKMNPLDGLSQNDIRTAIRNATGPRTALFVPEAAFELLAKRQIAKLTDPASQCIDAVYDELQRILAQLQMKDLGRFSVLRERVTEVVTNLLHKCRVPTKRMVTNLLHAELAFINTSHPDFIGSNRDAISQILAKLTAPEQAPLSPTSHTATSGASYAPVPPLSSSPATHTTGQSAPTAAGARGGGNVAPQHHYQHSPQQHHQPGYHAPPQAHHYQQPTQHVPSQSHSQQHQHQHQHHSSAADDSWGTSSSVSANAGQLQQGRVPGSLRPTAALFSDKERLETELIRTFHSSYHHIQYWCAIATY